MFYARGFKGSRWSAVLLYFVGIVASRLVGILHLAEHIGLANQRLVRKYSSLVEFN